jgi:hypothetical protein
MQDVAGDEDNDEMVDASDDERIDAADAECVTIRAPLVFVVTEFFRDTSNIIIFWTMASVIASIR